MRYILLLFAFIAPLQAFVLPRQSRFNRVIRFSSSTDVSDLPDSLIDAANIAAEATAAYVSTAGPLARCRVDFDTSIGDETFTLLKTSTEFMQHFITACCYAMIQGLQERKQQDMIMVAQARAEIKQLQQEANPDEDKIAELQQIIDFGGQDNNKWDGPVARIYMPDEGNAALARRDWLGESPKVPPCVQFSSCGGVQQQDITKDALVFFFCPKASESSAVEEILQRTEAQANNLKATIFVNPNLVDMGVTGFGLSGRLLRERLIEPLQYTYYLRTLQWGALTRTWPRAYSVWQEDESAAGGYRLIKTLDRLPTNPEVEDIYDIENGLMEERQGGGFLDQLGDFVNGMMRL